MGAQREGARIGVRAGRGVEYFAVFGGALSSDPSILLIFLLAAPAGLGVTLDTAIVYVGSAVPSLAAFAYAGSIELEEVFAMIPTKYNDALIGFIIAAVGLYTLFTR